MRQKGIPNGGSSYRKTIRSESKTYAIMYTTTNNQNSSSAEHFTSLFRYQLGCNMALKR